MAALLPTVTTTTILDRLASEGDEEIWRAFDERFRPILYTFALRLGLSSADAADTAQESLVRFLMAYREGRYRRERGRLSSWLIGIARLCAAEHRRLAARGAVVGGTSKLGDIPAATELDAAWSESCRQQILRQALERLRRGTRMDERTITAFERLLAGRSANEVADELAMSTNDVYLAKHRCLRALRAVVEELRTAYEVE